MAKRFAAHFGTLDNLGQLASMGFTEAGIVTQFGGNPSPAAIHNAGIPTATLNCFNDGACPPGTAGGQYAGYFQSCVGNGWNAIGGEGVDGSVVTVVQNYCPYVNYGGIIGDSQGNMYASPWNHPGGGGHGHWDYIETYNNSNQYRDPSASLGWSRSAGAAHLGILIMYGPSPAADVNTYINIIDRNGCDTVLFWGGYSGASSACVGLAQQLINHYGAAKGGTPATSGGGKAAAAAPVKHPVVHCPCRHLQIGFRGVTGSSTSQHMEFKVQLIGSAGWVDDNEKWIMNKPYTGKLQLWCRSDSGTSTTPPTTSSGVQGAAWYSPATGSTMEATYTIWLAAARANAVAQHVPDAEEAEREASVLQLYKAHYGTSDGNPPQTKTTTTKTTTTKGKTWKMMDFFPDKNGKFAIYIGSDTAEVRHYNVCFADKGSTPAYRIVME